METHNNDIPVNSIDLSGFSGKRVLFMAGGTGGHVIPGLTVANLLSEYGATIEWLGTSKGIESKLVPESGIKLHFISVNGLRGKGLKSWLIAPYMLFKAICESYNVIKQFNPDCVVGMGGFASGPGGVAAYLKRKPVIVHEQNAIAGTTNRLLSKISARILQAFDGAFKKESRAVTTGNPVRKSISDIEQSISYVSDELKVLVLGGSLGAKPLNDVLPDAFASLQNDGVKLNVWHQCGNAHIDSVSKRYIESNLEAKVDTFISSMDEAYKWADIIICRAGALTVSEVSCAGKCAVFIPLPHAIDNHQYYNAMSLVEKNAGFMLDQAEMTTEKVKALITQFKLNPDLAIEMGKNARAIAHLNSADLIAHYCLEAIRER